MERWEQIYQEFSATIYKVGINPCVDVPKTVSEAFGQRGFIPVLMTLKNNKFRATLVPIGEGRHRLYINGEMRKKTKVDVDDKIHLILEVDSKPRVTQMPEEFASALEKNRKAKQAFERLPPSHQREILSYLNYLKRPETLRKNIKKVITSLLDTD